MSAISSTRIARNAICLVFLASASACAGTREPSYPVPDEPGIYAFTTSDNLRRLDGDRDWEVETWPERSNIPGNVQFVINEPALAGRSAGNSVELWRVAWVRSEIDPQGQAMPIQGSEWAVAPLAPFAIPFRYELPAGQTDDRAHRADRAARARPLHPARRQSGCAPGAGRRRLERHRPAAIFRDELRRPL